MKMMINKSQAGSQTPDQQFCFVPSNSSAEARWERRGRRFPGSLCVSFLVMDVAWNHVLSSFGIGGLDSENQQRHTEGDDRRGARGEFRVDEGGSFYNPPQEFSPKLQGESNEHGQARNHTYSLSSPSPSRVTEEIHSLQTHRSVHGVHPIESNLLL
jgi:hypothetical protein